MIEKPDTILRTVNLHMTFGDVLVRKGRNLCSERGLVYSLQSGNGLGKATLINNISGFLRQDSDRMEVRGLTIVRFLPYLVNYPCIGRTFHNLRLATLMTVAKKIILTVEKCMFSRPSKKQRRRVDAFFDKVSITSKYCERVEKISHEQQKTLTIGCCIANQRCRPAVTSLWQALHSQQIQSN